MNGDPLFVEDVRRDLVAVARACPTPIPRESFPPQELVWAGLCAALCEELPVPRGTLGHLAFIAELVHGTLEIHTRVTERSIGEGTALNKMAILSGDFLYTCALERIPDLDHEGLENETHERILASCRGKLLGSIDSRVGSWWAALKRRERSRLNPGGMAALCLTAPAILLGWPEDDRAAIDPLARRWAKSLMLRRPFIPRAPRALAPLATAIRAVHPYPVSAPEGARP